MLLIILEFYKVRDKDCVQLIQELQALYRDLEDFDETINRESKSKYEPPAPPIPKLLTPSNTKSQYNPVGSKRTVGNSKLANIKSSWEEHNIRVRNPLYPQMANQRSLYE